MGYGYSGFSLSSFLPGFDIYSVLAALAGLASLGLSFFIFWKFVGAPEGKQLKQTADHTAFLERFLRFKQLIVGDILRWAYIFLALLTLLEGLLLSGYMITLVALSGSLFFIALLNLLWTAILELILRVIFEMSMLTVLVAKDTGSIHAILAKKYGDADSLSTGFDAAPVQPPMGSQPLAYPRQQAQIQHQPRIQPQPNQYRPTSGWTCGTCGNPGNSGAFCSQCGSPRP